jgi:hypothetical protein
MLEAITIGGAIGATIAVPFYRSRFSFYWATGWIAAATAALFVGKL